MVHVIFPMLKFLYFALVISEVCVACPVRLFAIVSWSVAFLVFCSSIDSLIPEQHVSTSKYHCLPRRVKDFMDPSPRRLIMSNILSGSVFLLRSYMSSRFCWRGSLLSVGSVRPGLLLIAVTAGTLHRWLSGCFIASARRSVQDRGESTERHRTSVVTARTRRVVTWRKPCRSSQRYSFEGCSFRLLKTRRWLLRWQVWIERGI